MRKAKYRNVSILLPAMDETYSLRETVETILDTCDREDLAEFILLLCDRTTEESRAVATRLIKDYGDRVPIYIHEQELPFVGGAIREGIDLAKGSHVVMMSSDLETDPNVIHTFIEKAKEHPNYIITATRWKQGGGFEHYNKIKLICNLIFERSIGMFYGSPLSDLTYAYRIFPTALMQRIRWEELKHPFFLETALKPMRLGIRFIEVPGHWAARTEGVSQNSFFANFRYFRTAWHNRFLGRDKILKNAK
ncbi:MAG: glycosyltransferase family 2 protein [Lachnospiraceae bacterium]|nr:glycosyltransferase family 2 protein [Lachnospiraceae bacterium]